MKRILSALIVAMGLSATLVANGDKTTTPPKPITDTIVVPWCEIWPWDPLCWFLP